MGWIHWAAAASLALTASAASAQEQVAAVVSEAVGEFGAEVLQLQDERYQRMTVPVMINGEGPYNFMVDTGAQASVMSHALADQLQLGNRSTATLVGMASERQVTTAQIDELSFGSGSFRDGTAALVDGANIGGADGILGLDSLANRRILIDFENRVMEVAHPEERASNRGFDIVVRARQVHGQLIIARAVIDGVRTAVIVDTGAQGSIGNPALLRRLRSSRHQADTEMTDINGVQASGLVRIARSLEMDRASISNFPITFARSPTFEALGLDEEPAMILGMAELRLFRRVAIDFASRRVLFDLPEGVRLSNTTDFGRL
ncbi:retroviral-like aspartic protease family protein [Altererythrobacter sp. KTW20L]|uniref:retroviral-like aspartic protease family protein n=1 Tax=Altererythrobacter sp. KTW20L TaxID=2942210 RepID=UPI0020BEC51B|nr:retroviral-like aspartic protease family protein [Altererythrobacter sp. KTW20L]MCL6250414.1 retroviral-like aspartic protease family protein [Altererythrobacter sp. KTW20L]